MSNTDYSHDLITRILSAITDLDIFGDFDNCHDAVRDVLGDDLGNEAMIAVGWLKPSSPCRVPEGSGFRCESKTLEDSTS